MADDTVTEVTRRSWLSRLGGAVKGVLIGLALAAVGLGVLWWNEGNRVMEQRSIQEGAGAVITIDADQPDPANEGRLVHATAVADTTQTIRDPQFGVAARALRLERRVEMYQWKEISESRTETKTGGGTETVTTYRYEGHWAPEPVPSQAFKQSDRVNPTSMPIPSRMSFPDQVTFGGFTLTQQQVMRIGPSRVMDLAPADFADLSPDLASRLVFTPDGLYLPAGGRSTAPATQPAATPQPTPEQPAADDQAGGHLATGEADPAHVADASEEAAASADAPPVGADAAPDAAPVAEPAAAPETEPVAGPEVASPSPSALVEGLMPAEPRIGDARIRFHIVEPQTVSIVAQQTASPGFRPYATQAGMPIDQIVTGDRTAEQMFQQMESASRLKVWLIRAGGLIAVFIGLRMVLGPLQVISDVIPFIGRLVGAGLSLVSFALAASLSLIVIATAWLAYRPMIGVPLLLVAGAFAGFALWRGLTARRQRRPAGA